MLKAVLFDLDGTLLPMDQEEFVKDYFKRLAGRLAPAGYEPNALTDAVWRGTAAMVKNDGSRTNEAAFWESFSHRFGAEKTGRDKPLFDAFYREEFQKTQAVCGFNPLAAEAVDTARRLGYTVALATNPIFPRVATEHRIRFAGLEPEAFALCTTYETIGYCKPNPAYYREIAQRLGVRPEECLMVGNDVTEDMAAAQTGMAVFLLTDCLINKDGAALSAFPHGGFRELIAQLNGLKSAE